MPHTARSRLVTWAARLCFGTPLMVLGVSMYLWTTEHLAAQRVARVTAVVVRDVDQTAAPRITRMMEPPLRVAVRDAASVERAQVLESARLELAAADPLARVEGAAALASVGGDAVAPELMAALYDRDARVREEVIHALTGMGDELAMPALGVALRDPDENVRRAALAELGELDSASADRLLQATAADAGDPLRAIAADVLTDR